MAKLMAEITLHAGGLWNGCVFFEVIHPLTKESHKSYHLKSVRAFCRENNLTEDPELLSWLPKLHYSIKGWEVPAQFLDPNRIVSSACEYLSKVKTEQKLGWD